MILHATLVAGRRGGDWRGVLVRGASGAGKSSLAFQLMHQGWRLAADDRVLIWRSGAGLYGRAPDSLHGLMEARGVGVRTVPALRFVRIEQVIDAAEPGVEPERVPDRSWVTIDDVSLPRLVLNLTAPTAAAAATLWCGAGSV